jgi:hypothetical protein
LNHGLTCSSKQTQPHGPVRLEKCPDFAALFVGTRGQNLV